MAHSDTFRPQPVERIHLSLPAGLLARVDAVADGRPRSVVIRRLVEQGLGGPVEGPPVPSVEPVVPVVEREWARAGLRPASALVNDGDFDREPFEG